MSYAVRMSLTLLMSEEANDVCTAYGGQAPLVGEGCCSGSSAALSDMLGLHCSAAAL